jgi:ESS family glutamate:Na+ symporter
VRSWGTGAHDRADLVYTLVLSLLVYFVGQWLADRVRLLKRFSIPGPVVGGSLVAAALARADAFLGTRVAFTMTLKDTLLQMFSSPWGSPRTCGCWSGVARACPYSLGWAPRSSSYRTPSAWLPPASWTVGLLGGGITLTGGHETGTAYAGRFGETMNLQGAPELTMASATAGLVIGAVVGGPLAEYLIRRHRLSASSRPSPP